MIMATVALLEQAHPNGSRNRELDERKPLPLLRLSEDSKGRAACRRA